jgi:uncharacterized Fe-S cluster protein YjdI
VFRAPSALDPGNLFSTIWIFFNDDITQYRKRVGSLIWFMVNTRPDVPFSVATMARYGHNPAQKHFTNVKKIFRYLSGSTDLCVRYSFSPDSLFGFVDADWAGKHANNCMSRSGFVFTVANTPISWVSKKQSCVSVIDGKRVYCRCPSRPGSGLAAIVHHGNLSGRAPAESPDCIIPG